MGTLLPASVLIAIALPVCAYAGQESPATAKPPAAPTSQPAPATQPAPAAPAAPASMPGAEEPRSLFDESWRQFDIGGRGLSMAGDPARYQRYQDFGNGVLFQGRYAVDHPEWSFKGEALNVGWRDQRYAASYERAGRLTFHGLWDEIPQFYSVDTKTPYTSSATGVLLLDDTIQRAIQDKQAALSAYLPVAPQFDLRERRAIGRLDLVAVASEQVDIRGTFTTTEHRGELPWGASFGFSNDVEVALPYDSRTNDLTVGAEWKTDKAMLRIAYDGSWFDDQSDTLIWDSPLRLDDAVENPGRGRMALWPSNSANTVSGGGYMKLAHNTQVTGFLSYGTYSNDEPLQPFTINSALPQLTLPRATADAQANIFSTNVGMVSRPKDDWRFTARLRHNNYSNQTPAGGIPEIVSYDSSVSESTTLGPQPFSHSQTDLNLDATWTATTWTRPFAITGGYAYTHGSYDFRTFERSSENGVYVSADTVGSQWFTVRARYDYGSRGGSGLDEASLVQIGEQPGLRHYDIANRSRNRFTGIVDVTPNELWTISGSAGIGSDDYGDSQFGLQDTSVRTFTLAVDYAQPKGWRGGISYDYERYTGAQRSRSASPGEQAADPNRDWTVDTKERVNYVLIHLEPPPFGHAEFRASYEYAFSRGSYLYGIVPGGPLPVPSQLPDVFNKLQDLKLEARYRLSDRLAATLSYAYEPFSVYDFAFDPTVVDSIIQPSSLVLGYVYRPYTAHSVVAGLRYRW
jgi:MtrB/PioB family decaheme-associated outer membrane protein